MPITATSNHSAKVYIKFTGLGDNILYDITEAKVMSEFGTESSPGIEDYNVWGDLFTRGVITSKGLTATMTTLVNKGAIADNLRAIFRSGKASEHFVDIYYVPNIDGETPETQADYYQSAILAVTKAGGGAATDIQMFEMELNLTANNSPALVNVVDIPITTFPTFATFTAVSTVAGEVNFDWTINNPDTLTIDSFDIKEVNVVAPVESVSGITLSHDETGVSAGTHQYFITGYVDGTPFVSSTVSVVVS